MFRKIIEAAKVALSVTFVDAIVGGFVYGIGKDIVDGIVHWNEPVYLMPRAYDPIWRNAGFIPSAYVCSSPARCEPNGKASLQYFVLLKEYEVRRWGFDPAREIPIKGYPFI